MHWELQAAIIDALKAATRLMKAHAKRQESQNNANGVR